MLRPFFSYYGGKWRDAKRYPAPLCSTIVEPFAGSAGYAMRYPSRRVVLCDVDPIIVGVWSYLLSVSPREVLALPDVPMDGTVDDIDAPQEARWLIGFWLNRGAESPRRTPSKWMRSGIRPGSFWGASVRQRIASQVESIRHWRVFECDYQDAPASDATWFVDPPYQRMGKRYRHGSRAIDFDRLGVWCRSRREQVIVCEQDGADWLPFQAMGSRKTTRKGSRSAEAVWLMANKEV